MLVLSNQNMDDIVIDQRLLWKCCGLYSDLNSLFSWFVVDSWISKCIVILRIFREYSTVHIVGNNDESSIGWILK